MQIDNYAKVDFHIHSAASKTKSGDVDKTKKNIFENIDTLFERMNNSKVNMFSFTDHNTFDYELYIKTLNYISSENFQYKHIQSILPGVEFDLDFDNKNLRTHATCIFDDNNIEDIRKIDGVIRRKVGKRSYNEVKFSEEELNSILREINIDFILIVHQRTDIQNNDVHGDNDFSKLEPAVKERLMYCDYFTMYESNQHMFRFRFEELKEESLFSANFITGTDCHTWSNYPDISKVGIDFDFTYIKMDFSFTGLKVAVTGNGERRILKNLPISNEKTYDSISYILNGQKKDIPLSNGINVIIGGNTSGKSLMLAKIFNRMDHSKNGINFLEKWNMDFFSSNVAENKIEYTKQGDVRTMFEDGGTGLVSKFRELFSSINYEEHLAVVDELAKKILSIANRNSKIDELHKSIDCIINIPNYDDVTYYPLVSPLPLKPKNPSKGIKSRFDKLDVYLDELINLVDDVDKTILSDVKDELSTPKEKYENRSDLENLKINTFNSFISAKDDYLKYIQDKSVTVTELELMQYDKVVSDYLNDLDQLIELKLQKKTSILNKIVQFIVEPISNPKGDLSYVTSPKVQKYTLQIQEKILMSAFRSNTDFLFVDDIDSIDVQYFINNLRRNTSEVIDKMNYYQKYLTLVGIELRKNYFNDTFKVLEKDEPVQDTKSPGNNAIYYIKTKAETMNNKLVIFDQPEDDVAPEKIRTDLIKSLSKIAASNQVIIVTHNPQLVVNLDVDNVICLDDSEDVFKIHHGPLYLKGETDILGIIADKLDGGKDALKERWKRYE